MEPRLVVIIVIVVVAVVLVLWMRHEAAEKTEDGRPELGTLVPSPGSKDVVPTAPVSVTFLSPMDGTTVTGGTVFLVDDEGSTVQACVSYDSSTNTATLTPASQLECDAKYKAVVLGGKNGVRSSTGGHLHATVTWVFETAAAPKTYSLWQDTVVPSQGTFASLQVVGTVFNVDTPGYVTALRCYRFDNGTNTVGMLWDHNKNLLATVAFPALPKEGWVVAPLPVPVPILAGVNYITSYTVGGVTASTASYFSSHGVDNGPLHAPADTVTLHNGVWNNTGSSDPFPGTSGSGHSYFADLVFQPGSTPFSCDC